MKKPHPLLLVIAAPVLALVAYVAWPEPPLSPLYCEGGVVDERSGGGACFVLSDTKLDADPESVGSGMWQGGGRAGGPSGSRLGVRRTGSGKYTLVLDGVVAGAMERDGRWIHVTFKGSAGKFSLRSDRAGLMI